MEITKEITDAVRKAVEELGSQSELSRRSGVSQGTISDICSVQRRRNRFSKGTFAALSPFISRYLEHSSPVSFRPVVPPPPADYILNRITEIYSSLGRAERAELLAAAEHLAEKRTDPAPVYLSPPCTEKLS